MEIFNDELVLARDHYQKLLKKIIREETPYVVYNKRFAVERVTYPIVLTFFEGERKLGYFDHRFFEIGLNQALLKITNTETILDILRHELAHYFTYIAYRSDYHNLAPHGLEFRSVCEEMDWGQHISKPTLDLSLVPSAQSDEKVLKRVKALLNLSESSNEHESKLATLKANKLLLKHNLSLFDGPSEETFYRTSIFSVKRKNAKMQAMGSIIEHFNVKTYYSYGESIVSLKAYGRKTHLDLALYLAEFLDSEMERLWRLAKNRDSLSGLRDKNSFFIGLALGYTKKVQDLRNEEFTPSEKKSLVLIEKEVDRHFNRDIQGLGASRSQASLSWSSMESGESYGRNLSLHRPVTNENGKTLYLE